jgi:RNA polymerase sigma factor for flagellar operon FliA
MQNALKAYQRTQRDQLIQDHLEYVQHVIHQMLSRLPDGVDLENLQQAGVYGLVQAASQFEPGRGTKFSTFAYRRIKGEVIDELRRNSPLSQEMLRRIGLVQQSLEILTPPVTTAALAAHTGLTTEKVESALEARRLTTSSILDEELMSASDTDETTNDADALQDEQKQLLASGIKSLPDQQRIVLTMYYLDDMRLKEIAQVMNLSESRISRVLSQAEFRLREFVRAKE